MTPDEGGFDQPIPGYEVMDHLGSGGTGSVYKARQDALGRIVAVKVLRRDRAERETTLQRMAKEARLLARLDHPNIVRSIDFGQSGNLMYFTMEFVDGRSARDLLESQGAFPVLDALHIADQVALALQHAADRGVVHRDVKPGNVLLGKDGSVKLSDFGLARGLLDRSLTRDGTTVGTPQYMAPEQVRHARRADLRSDFYSLGATLYHLITGQAPFEGESVAEVLHQVLYGQPIPPESLRPEVPSSLSRVLARLMARNPARRYPDADSLRRDLALVRRQWEAEGGVEDPSVGLSWQESRQSPRVWQTHTGWWVGAAGLVLLGALGALFLRGGDDGPTSAEQQKQERGLLARLELQLQEEDARALEVLGRLTALRKEGTLGSASALERQSLQDRAGKAVRAQVELLVARALQESEGELGRGRLQQADRVLADSMQAALVAQFGATAGRPDTGNVFDLGAEVDVAWNRAQARLEERRNQLLGRLQSALRDQELQFDRALHLGDAEGPGLLEAGRMKAGRALLDTWNEARDEALLRSFHEGVREANLPAATADLGVEQLLAGLPEAFVSEYRADRVGQRLQADWNDALRRVQEQVIEAVDALAAAHGARILAGEIRPEPEAWMASLEEALQAQGLDRAEIPRDPNDWQPSVERYEAGIRAAVKQGRETERGQRLRRLVEGTASEDGLRDWFLQRDFVAARIWLEAQDPWLIEPVVDEWHEVLEEAQAFVDRVHQALVAAQGQTVELLDDRGIKHVGTLQYPDAEGKLRVGRSRLALTELALTSMLALSGDAPPTALVDALLALVWQRSEKDLEELQARVGTLAQSPAQAFLVEEVQIRQAEAQKGAQALEEEVRLLFQSLMEGVDDGRFDQAEEALKKLRSSRRYRETDQWKAHRSGLPELTARLAERRVVHDRLDQLASLYPNADQLDLAQDGRVTLCYEFGRVEQGKDLDLGGAAARIEDGALSVPQDKTLDRAKIWGPSLPLPVDVSRPFTLVVELLAPFEQEQVPKFVGLRAGPVCVGIFRPEMDFPSQCAVWGGDLDEYAKHFFDAAMGLTEAEEPPTITGIGLERAQQQTLELRFRPTPEPSFELWLDGTLRHKGPLRDLETKERRRWEVRSAGALEVHRLWFEGTLEPD